LVPTPRKYWPSIHFSILTKDKEISKIVLEIYFSLYVNPNNNHIPLSLI